MAIAVVPDLMPFLDYALAFHRKRLNRMARYEPGRFDAIFRQEVEESLSTNLAELAARQGIRRFGTEIGNPQ